MTVVLAFMLERLALGLRVAWQSCVLYVTSPVLLGVALVPVVFRITQTLRGDGTPDGSLVSESVVGAFRVILAVTILLVAAGWQPLTGGGLHPPSLAGTGSAWGDPRLDWGRLALDIAAYALVYVVANLLVAGLASESVLASVPRGSMELETLRGVAHFGIKNILVIPVATVHILWALRLIDLPSTDA